VIIQGGWAIHGVGEGLKEVQKLFK